MISKTKDQFNLNNKQVYKYNIVKHKNIIINHEEILNNLNKNSNDLNGKIDEYFYYKIPLDNRILHRFQFILNE